MRDLKLVSDRGGLYEKVQHWQDQAVMEVVKSVSAFGKSIKNDLIISVSGHPVPNFLPPNPQGRNEVKWANLNLIDLIFNMDYSKKPDFKKHQLIQKELKDPNKIVMLLGNYEQGAKYKFPRDETLLKYLVQNVQNKWNNGVGVYFYLTLSGNQIEMLRNGPFRQAAKPRWTEPH
jgi:uncharacterized lipoprotein YddW (UPF0748 family)